jgi:hypothetical protein
MSKRVGLRHVQSIGAKVRAAAVCPEGEQFTNGSFGTGDWTGWTRNPTDPNHWTLLGGGLPAALFQALLTDPIGPIHCPRATGTLEQDFANVIPTSCFVAAAVFHVETYWTTDICNPVSPALWQVEVLYTDGTSTILDLTGDPVSTWVTHDLKAILQAGKTVKGIRFTATVDACGGTGIGKTEVEAAACTCSMPYTLVVSLNDASMGTTSPAPATYKEAVGSTVNVTAVPNTGYYLNYWLLDGVNVGSANPYTVTMNADHRLQAVFAQAVIGWLGTWAKRRKITVDHTKLSADESNFPNALPISSNSGLTGADLTSIFTELGSSSLKIAVTLSDGQTQCYVEVDQWQNTSGKALLWVGVPAISHTTDTVLYLYYDHTQPDNTVYVGTRGSTPAQNVWDLDFYGVWHCNEDPTKGNVKDSTSNNIDLMMFNPASSQLVDSQLGKGYQLNGTTQNLRCAHIESWAALGLYTIEIWVKPTGSANGFVYGECKDATINTYADESEWIVTNPHIWVENNRDTSKNTVNNSVPLNAFTLLQIQHTFATYQWDVFVNGIEDANFPYTESPITLYTSDGYFKVGCRMAQTNFFAGIVDEIRWSRKIRSADWLLATYNTETDNFQSWGAEETRP